MLISHIAQHSGHAISLVENLDNPPIAAVRQPTIFGYHTQDFGEVISKLKNIPSKKRDFTAKELNTSKRRLNSIYPYNIKVTYYQKSTDFRKNERNFKNFVTKTFEEANISNSYYNAREYEILTLAAILFFPISQPQGIKYKYQSLKQFLVFFSMTRGDFILSTHHLQMNLYNRGICLSKCSDTINTRSRKKTLWCINEKIVEQYLADLRNNKGYCQHLNKIVKWV